MLAGSFATGLMPILIKASNKFMNLISILGAGLLVGVALIIIIPEGMLTLNQALMAQKRIHIEADLAHANMTAIEVIRLHMPSEDSADGSVALYLGGSLIFGFLIMLLIDQIFHIIKERFG